MNVYINYLAVLVAAIVGFGIGGPWYGFFARPWLAAIGKTEAEVKSGNASSASRTGSGQHHLRIKPR